MQDGHAQLAQRVRQWAAWAIRGRHPAAHIHVEDFLDARPSRSAQTRNIQAALFAYHTLLEFLGGSMARRWRATLVITLEPSRSLLRGPRSIGKWIAGPCGPPFLFLYLREWGKWPHTCETLIRPVRWAAAVRGREDVFVFYKSSRSGAQFVRCLTVEHYPPDFRDPQ